MSSKNINSTRFTLEDTEKNAEKLWKGMTKNPRRECFWMKNILLRYPWQSLERFSKPNFGSIRRFRTMTGLEIENWIEKRGRTVRKFRSTRPRTESNFRFGLTSCRSQNLPSVKFWSPVAPLSGIRQFFSRNLVKFTPCLTPPRIYTKSDKAKLKLPFNWADDEFFFYFGRPFRRHGHHLWLNGQEVLAMGSPVIKDLAEGVPRTCTVWQEHFFGTPRPRFPTARHQSSSAGHAIIWSIVFLFAERNFRLCVNRNFGTIFDPVLPEPNRIFGLLNLSIFSQM